MKNRKSYYSLLLALVLCLCLTACGGSGDTIDDGGEDYSGNEVNTPDSFEGMVKDSELATNYAMYWGTWVDADNNSELIVAMADSGDEVRFDLYQDGSIEASGFVQFSQEYSGDYFYNEFDGWAHHCWLADDGTLQIEGFGGFEKDTSAGDMDASDTGAADDVSALAGMWYLDGDVNAASWIELGAVALQKIGEHRLRVPYLVGFDHPIRHRRIAFFPQAARICFKSIQICT